MTELQGKNVVVIGASEGVGREIVAAAHAENAHVLAVARRAEPLARLSAALPGTMTLSADARDDETPDRVFETLVPDLLVLAGGAHPPMGLVQDLSWEQFSVNWNADLKASFLFCQAALRRPLPPGATVLLISSGAGIGGSHLSGGYAGAKRMQMFLAEYCQKQADHRNLGIRFLALAPMRIMPETSLGRVAVASYSEFLGITPAEFVADMSSPTPAQVAIAALNLAQEGSKREGSLFGVSASGLEALG
jgi:NAD(P)-dependent dehydrogenase (short-subunit alcohol dehydrogenase family)